MAINLEIGKTYRDRLGRLVTITREGNIENFPFAADNCNTYTANGSYLENSEHDNDLIEEANSFRTQQEVWSYLSKGGYITTAHEATPDYCLGFTKEGRLSKFDIFGNYEHKVEMEFSVPSFWKIAEIQTKSKWYHSIPEQGILCWVDDYYKGRQQITGLKVVVAYEPAREQPFVIYRSEATGTVGFKYAVPATLEELAKYIYKCE